MTQLRSMFGDDVVPNMLSDNPCPRVDKHNALGGLGRLLVHFTGREHMLLMHLRHLFGPEDVDCIFKL